CSYLGIAPKTKESNKKITYGRINKKGRKLARSFLSQVIFHFIGSSEYYEELYQQKKKSRGTGKAIVTMMRRLMVIIYHMLKKEQPFNKINRRLHLAKMNDWLKFIKKVKSMKEEDFQKWEHDIHLKYDVEYKEKIRKKLIMNKKSA
ncbi:MAG: transposase, partial [Spirochaetales bacterium]|nr:transposase [Spirochaetales bacterium]